MFNRSREFKMFVSRPRGRPRTEKAIHDRGTPEIQARRKAQLPPDTPSHLGESPLGICYAHHLIDEDMYRAGIQFCRLRYAYEGILEDVRPTRSTPTAHWGRAVRSKHIDKSDDAKHELRIRVQYEESVRVLKSQGQAVYAAVLQTTSSEHIDERTLPYLRLGLMALHTYYRQRGVLT
jgi:hypothetical protein